jgi:hypothetical protein
VSGGPARSGRARPREGDDERMSSRRSVVRREPLLALLRRWWASPFSSRSATSEIVTRAAGPRVVPAADRLTVDHRGELSELATRLDASPDVGGPHLASRLRTVLAHDGPDLHRVIMAHVHDADAVALEARVAALRAASDAWARARASYAPDVARDFGARADQAHEDWFILKRLLDARWAARTQQAGKAASDAPPE